jgi:hypothetical protein
LIDIPQYQSNKLEYTYLPAYGPHLDVHIIPRSHRRSHHIRKVRKRHIGSGKREDWKGIRNHDTEQRNQNRSANEVLSKGNGLVLFFLILGGEEGEDHKGNATNKHPREPGGHYWKGAEIIHSTCSHENIV